MSSRINELLDQLWSLTDTHSLICPKHGTKESISEIVLRNFDGRTLWCDFYFPCGRIIGCEFQLYRLVERKWKDSEIGVVFVKELKQEGGLV